MKWFLILILLVVPPIAADVGHSIYPPRGEKSYSESQGNTRDHLEDASNASSIRFIVSKSKNFREFAFGTHDDVIASFTVVLGIFTALLFFATKKLTILAANQDESTKTIARAYVKISPFSPGINFVMPGIFYVRVEVKNWGNTPANVTDVMLKAIVLNPDESLPLNPNYTRVRIESEHHVFLVAGEGFIYSNPEAFKIQDSDISCVENGSKELYVIGYVDYTDGFGRGYRGGFARRYWHVADSKSDPARYANRQNLMFVTQEGYNYDEERT